MTGPIDDLALNRATVAGYDNSVDSYAAGTDHAPTADHLQALQRLVAAVGPGGRVLEVASGPGWDADLLETMGVTVDRTDQSEGFIAFQAGRGKAVARLDLISADLGGPWDGLVALYVIQHVGRGLVDGVIGRISAALRPGGTLLMSFQTGEGEQITTDAEGSYQVVRWRQADMIACLARHGLSIDWRSSFEGREGVWLTVIARRT
ncbi:class I SAM-dependent methyltransferase [Brevundimonas sp.]|uniref:class I SAM-dependent methyltransferase n=1 Tax=Brevundimonas sp. TaxID=1871086 RepID=UPI003D0EB9E3